MIWLIILPILSAFLLPMASNTNFITQREIRLTPFILLINVIISLFLLIKISEPQIINVGNFVAPLGISLYVDKLALIFVTMLNFGALILFSFNQQTNLKQDTLILLLIGGGCGLAISGDLFNIYVFYEVVAVASYGLVASNGKDSYASSIRFLIVGALGSALLLLGIAIIYAITGTLNLAHLASQKHLLNNELGLTAFVMIVIGLGVKAELFPVNTWVPEVYTTTSIKITALLAGFISKLPLLIILRLLVSIYDETSANLLLLTLGILSLISGELAALHVVYKSSKNLRQILAFSSIGQLGLVAIAFSISGKFGIIAGVSLALHHAFVKSSLFILSTQTLNVYKNKLASGIFLLLILSLIGIPPLPGFWAKLILLQGALSTHNAFFQFAVIIILITTVIETIYFMQIAKSMFNPSIKTVNIGYGLKIAIIFTLLIFLSILNIGTFTEYLDSVALQIIAHK
jgi:formate hydrogenlyase subunit 3/multisubunit Na+/H+ antiporter MnhD subunit